MTRVMTVRRAATAVVGAVTLVLGGASVASAHGGPGDIEFGEPEQTGPLEVTFPIRVTYQNDGHDAEGVEDVSLTGVGEDGTTFGPVDPLMPGDAPGVWIATVELPGPGGWDLTLLIGEPESSGAIVVEVADLDAPAPDNTVEVESGDPDDAGEPAPEVTAGGEPDDEAAGDDDALGATDSDDGDGIPFFAVLAGFLAAVAAGLLGYRWVTSRQTATEES